MNRLGKLVCLATLSVSLLAPGLSGAAPPAPPCPPLPAAPGWLELVVSTPEEASFGGPKLRQADVVWTEMVDGAKRSIDWAIFYASEQEGSRLQPVIDALIRAAGRKVTVRILADAHFRKTYPETLARLNAVEGIEVALLDVGRHMGGVMHAKYFVVDGERAYIGSQNFDWRSLQHILETGMRFDDERLAGALGAVFEMDWRLAHGKDGRAVPPVPCSTSTRTAGKQETTVQLLASPSSHLPRGVDWELPVLLQTIAQARKRLDLQVMTYGTKDHGGEKGLSLHKALIAAGKRGVQVRVLVANWAQRKKTIGALKKLQKAAGVNVKIVTVPEHPSGFIPFARVIHAKYLVVDDDTLWLGTSNWEPGYFHESRNVGLLVSDPPLNRQAEELFEALWSSDWAKLVDPKHWYKAPRIKK